jgi:lipopolysaccharide transport system ATP-binding protein
MSSKDIAIKVENISKLYRIGAKENMHDSFARTMFDFMRSPWRNYRKYRSLYKFDDINPDQHHNPGKNQSDIIWALRDVSFEVKQGEMLGIIGRNGAGKSTLLKIMCRITDPTTGCVEIRGRISSLLEVGTGFHPELTGRENVYLNGTILGMTKNEVNRKFEEIVDFSGIEKFIDTPVKRYSSGMKVRLAFAVAAHLEPEVLIIDEVLAVGDAAFQKKCLNKMEDVGQQGRTVLFVSHSMPSVTRLCQRAILLHEGKLLVDGNTHHVVNAYLNAECTMTAVHEWSDCAKAPGNEVVRLRAVRIRTKNGLVTAAVDIRQPVGLEMEYEVLKPGSHFLPNFNVFDGDGVWVFTTMDQDPTWRGRHRPPGRYISTAWIPGNFLAEGSLYVEPAMMTPAPFVAHFCERDAVVFQVVDSNAGDSSRGDWTGKMRGVVRPLLNWTTQVFPAAREAEDMVVGNRVS